MTRSARILLTLHDGVTRIGYLGGVAALVLITVCYVYEVAYTKQFIAAQHLPDLRQPPENPGLD